MKINFFVRFLDYPFVNIEYFENYNMAYNFCRWMECDCEIWHCSDYLDECVRMCKIKYY